MLCKKIVEKLMIYSLLTKYYLMHLVHGSGTLNIEDKNLKKTFTEKLIEKSMTSQLTLLKKALNILKPGHEMLYSTCSILSCENENIIEKALKGQKAKIVPIEFEGKDSLPLLPTKIEGTLSVMPTELYEGFFIAKIQKCHN